MMKRWIFSIFAAGVLCASEPDGVLKMRLSWGHEAASTSAYYARFVPGQGLEVRDVSPYSLEAGEGERDGVWQTRAGAGDIDGVEFSLAYDTRASRPRQDLHIIWADLIAAGDADTARRLGQDASQRVNAPKLTVQMNPEGTAGFSITVDQLRAERAIWIPSLHAYLAAGDQLIPFDEHRESLKAREGQRILDRIQNEPEATYEQFTALWEDMGHPDFTYPEQRGPGHIVGLTWDSAIPKFGIDRGAGVWNDYGNPDRFRFWFSFGDIAQGIKKTWKSQRLEDGLPIITTVFEEDGIRYAVEQFAHPLNGPPKERRGDISMVLLQKVTVTELLGRARHVPITLSHRRQFEPYVNTTMFEEQDGGTHLFREAGNGRVLFSVEGAGSPFVWSGVRDYQREQRRIDATTFVELDAKGSRELIVKLPSPMTSPTDVTTLKSLQYSHARAETEKFWSAYVDRGAQFIVPEKVVNDLFRASLWHALRLPRRHGGEQEDVRIDLPYSNFAYSQTGTPWPVNQAVYVDYMIYDLRGYHAISTEELLAQFRNNIEADGHVNGYANWVVYTPGMLYTVAQSYLLSRDRAAFERLLPYSLKALDWCLDQLRAGSRSTGPTKGLVRGPLNDGTGDGLWAFNQAYMFAGLDLFGQALEDAGHPRARESRRAAGEIREAIQRAFGAATMRSPLVQLRDHTWVPYVPCEANTYRRLLEQWYPTDVDTGAVHLLRLKALPGRGNLADYLLHDHEDNLFYRGLGMANEPIYNQQATAYLFRDDPTAVVRAFYSYIASAFSHSALEPVEHRWTHGQYFGPPSTDGAWFELYRNMLVHERDDGALVLAQATPRPWLADGKNIVVRRAPTYYGPLSMTITSRATTGRIEARVEMPTRQRPQTLVVRLRHPDKQTIRSVTVNGRGWTDFDPGKEWVRIPSPTEKVYSIEASY
jgi:hypothetical protein